MVKLVVDQSMLLHKKGAKCPDIDRHLSWAVKPLQLPNIQTHISNKCSYILETMKRLKWTTPALSPPEYNPKLSSLHKGNIHVPSLQPISDDSDIDFNISKIFKSQSQPDSDPNSSDIKCSKVRHNGSHVLSAQPHSESVELIEDSDALIEPKPLIKLEHVYHPKYKFNVEEGSWAPLAKQLCLIKNDGPIVISPPSSPSLSPTFTPLSLPLLSHTKSPQTNNNGSLVNLVLQWPGSVYTSDLLQGFQKMDLVKIGSTED